MRIVVNDFAASIGGGATILRSLYDYLIESGDKNEWYFLLNDLYIEETDNIKVILLKKEKKSRFRRLMFDLFYGRKLIKRLQPDVIFYLQNTLIHGVKCPQVMYMDQSIAFQKEKSFSFFSKEERKYAVYQHIIGYFNRKACKKADAVIVQTQWLQSAIERIRRKKQQKLLCIPPEVIIDSTKYYADNINMKVFFYPASEAVYKNHYCIYEAIKLVNRPELRMLLTLQPKNNGVQGCEYIGTISRYEVYQQLSKSVLVFPSYIESYGLPLKEAREIGTVIFAADTAFSREILSGYENAYFFNPFAPSELTDLIKQSLDGRIEHVKQSRTVKQKKEDNWLKVIRLLREVAACEGGA